MVELWYKKPAEGFTEALPIGNGSFGGMVFGGVTGERILLNLDTLWSGTEACWDKKQTLPDGELAKVRELVSEKKYWEAEQRMKASMLGVWNESYVSMGSLMWELQNLPPLQTYRRSLRLDTAIAESLAAFRDRKIAAHVWVSAPGQGMVAYLTSEGEPTTMELWMESPLAVNEIISSGEKLILHGTAPSHVEPDYVQCGCPIVYDKKHPGLRFSLLLGVDDTDGRVEALAGGRLRITGWSRLTLHVYAASGYRGFRVPPEKSFSRLDESNKALWEKGRNVPVRKLLLEQARSHQALFGRVELGLPEDGMLRLQSTDERLAGVKAGQQDLGLLTLLFHYGRYLMITASRPLNGLTQPANLQGIWCEDVRSVWSSNYTTNINLEMNYWLCGSCHLPECEEPLLRMTEELAQAGRETAKALGCEGFALHHNTDLWRQTVPASGEVKWAYWPMGGAWLTTFFYRHYLYTGDRAFLEKRALPIYCACVEFLLSYLEKGGDGIYRTSPATSPENTFWDEEGRECSVSRASVMDITLIREIFLNMMEMNRILERGEEANQVISEVLENLPPFRIGSWGQLQEWEEDFEECDPGHRHFAHLLGLHPFSQITRDGTPDLAVAAERAIERRTEGRKFFIGWNCAWLVNFYARLWDGEKALSCLWQMLSHSVYDNLFDLHPPLGENPGEREIFQIDGNYGVTAGMAELLVQSREHVIYLLPALPAEWKRGYVKGIMTCCGVCVDIRFAEGELLRGELHARREETVSLVCRQPFSVYRGRKRVCVARFFEKKLWRCVWRAERQGRYTVIPVRHPGIRTERCRNNP